VEIRRPGLVEWYANSPRGLEQGFTIEEQPAGRGSLLLELEVGGARASRRGDRVFLQAETGRRLAYGGLAAADSEGRALVARLEVPADSRLRLVVEDAGAAYPVVIDPLLTATADAQLESNQADAYLGASVAGAGDVNGDGYADVIVGATGFDAGEDPDGGAAFVFLGSASGIASGNPSTADARLVSYQRFSEMGSSVAGAGDVNGDGYGDVIVGAQSYSAGELYEGAAFVFLGSASGIADGDPSTADTRLEPDYTGARLGQTVAGAGDVNGDGYADAILGSEGAAYLFLGSASGIASGDSSTAAAELHPEHASSIDMSVASAGDVNGDGYADVIVGAYLVTADQVREGAAFVYLGGSSGIATAIEHRRSRAHVERAGCGAGLQRRGCGGRERRRIRRPDPGRPML
jgi:hypothetical protein